MSTVRALFLRTAPIVFALVAAFAPRAASAQCLTCVQNLSLPSGPVSATTATNNNTVPAASGLGSFTVTLQGIGAGFDVTSGSYVAWCGDYPNTGLTTTPPTLYSTYSLNLPPLAQRPAGAWNEVNFILNNKTLGGTISPTVIDVQAAIWDILVPVFALTDPNVPQSANTALLVAQAELNPAYVPTQVVVVDLYVNGFQDVTSGKGVQYSTQDLIIEVPLDSIGDYVWQDTNGNGIQDGGEPGINGVTLDLCADAGCNTIIATTTTNTYRGVQGMYEFAGLDAGTYYVSIPSGQSVLSGLQPSPVGQGTPGTDSNPNPSTVVLTPAAPSNQTIDFGFTPAGTSAIGDFVWDDSNGDGLQDNGESGIPGVTVDLCSDAACANVIATTTTDGNGNYYFTSLVAGTYYVQVVAATLPPNFVPTTPFVGSDTSKDSNGSLNGSPAQVVLPADYTDNTIDFGFVPPALGIIGDFVWSDLNGNGIQDAGEPGINNVTVYLYQVTNSGNVLLTHTTTVTNSGGDGYYQFTGLAAGTYSVVVDSTTLPPGGYTATTSNAPGSTTANDSNGSPATVVLATNSSVDETIDFGYVPPCTGSIGDLVWSDANTDGIPDNGEVGIPGVTVSLYTSPGNRFVVSTTTGANGSYEFSSVCAGTYAVTVAPPANFTADSTKFPVSNNVPENVGSGATVTLPVGGSYQNMDFGFYEQVNYNNQNCVTIGPYEIGVSFTSPNLVSNVTLGTAPYTFAVGIGPLPQGLSLNPATGVVSGTPATSGTFTIQAADYYHSVVFTTCPITVNPAVTANCAVITAQQGVAIAPVTITATGGTGTGYTFTATGLPAGLTISSAGTISGTPMVNGTFPYTVTIKDSANDTGTLNCSVTVVAPPPPQLAVVKTADSPAVAAGSVAGFTVTITNTGSITASGVTLSDPLPAGAGNDIHWAIDTAKGNPADFLITGATGSQTLVLNPSPTTLAGGAALTVHITGTTSVNDLTTSSNAALNASGLSGYTVLYEGTGSNQLSISNDTIVGNIGVGGGKVAFSGPGTIEGRVDFANASSGQYSSSNGSNVGPTSVNYSVPAVTTAINAVNSLSASLGGLSGTSIAYTNNSMTVNESAGVLRTANGVTYRVFNVTAYSATNSTTVTINGDGSGDPVVFNFAYSGNTNLGGQIVLSGLTPDQVMWNFTSSGKNVQLNNNGEVFQGVIVLPNDNFTSDNYNLTGRVYGGSDGNMQIVSGANVYAPAMTGTLNNTATVTANLIGSLSATASISLAAPSPAPALVSGDAATIGFWHNKNGQALIFSLNGGSSSTALANWLATSFPKLYGAGSSNNLTGKTNTDVAALFMTFFGASGQKTSAQIMSGALAVYVTDSALAGGSGAASYGFNVSTAGTGAKGYNTGSDGAALGLSNNTVYTVSQLLQAANAVSPPSSAAANALNDIFNGINTTGDIN